MEQKLEAEITDLCLTCKKRILAQNGKIGTTLKSFQSGECDCSAFSAKPPSAPEKWRTKIINWKDTSLNIPGIPQSVLEDIALIKIKIQAEIQAGQPRTKTCPFVFANSIGGEYVCTCGATISKEMLHVHLASLAKPPSADVPIKVEPNTCERNNRNGWRNSPEYREIALSKRIPIEKIIAGKIDYAVRIAEKNMWVKGTVLNLVSHNGFSYQATKRSRLAQQPPPQVSEAIKVLIISSEKVKVQQIPKFVLKRCGYRSQKEFKKQWETWYQKWDENATAYLIHFKTLDSAYKL